MKNCLKAIIFSMMIVWGCVGKTNDVKADDVFAKKCLFQTENEIYVQKGSTTEIDISRDKTLCMPTYNKRSYQFSKKGILKATKSGILKAKKRGETKMTVYCGKQKVASVKVIVTPKIRKKVKKIGLYTANGGKIFVEKQKNADSVWGSVLNKATYKKLIYKSSNEKIVTVDKKGNITTKKTGKAKITAYAVDGSGAKESIKIYVVKPQAATTENVTAKADKKVYNFSDNVVWYTVSNKSTERLGYGHRTGALFIRKDDQWVQISPEGDVYFDCGWYYILPKSKLNDGFAFDYFDTSEMTSGTYKYCYVYGGINVEFTFELIR